MKRLLHLVARLYPPGWRLRYGTELEALLDDLDPSWRNVLDVMKGGAHMRFTLASPALMAGAFGIAGAVVAGAIALNTPELFRSSGTLRVTTAETSRGDDPVPGHMRKAVTRMRDAQSGLDVRRVEVVKGPDGMVTVAMRDDDPRKAQLRTRELMTQLTTPGDPASPPPMEVIAMPDLPQEPAGPPRIARAGAGFGGGALLGMMVALVFRLSRRR